MTIWLSTTAALVYEGLLIKQLTKVVKFQAKPLWKVLIGQGMGKKMRLHIRRAWIMLGVWLLSAITVSQMV